MWGHLVCDAGGSISFWGSWWTKGFPQDYTSISCGLLITSCIWLEINCFMHNMFLLVPHREFSVSSIPFQTAFKYLPSVVTWSHEFLFLILQRLVVSCFQNPGHLFLQIYRFFLFYATAWEMWLFIFPYTATWVPIVVRISKLMSFVWPWQPGCQL